MKKYLAIFLALVLIVSMGACGEKEEKGNDSQVEVSDKEQKVTVEKGDWISATRENLTFEVMDNWVAEKREAADIEYYYFDESKKNYLLVSVQSSAMELSNSKINVEALLGGEIVDEEGLEFKENGFVVVGKDIGGYKLIYKDSRPTREDVITYTEFYTIYQDTIYWFCASVKDGYLDDYMDDIEHVISTIQTVSGEGNPIIE